MSTKAKVEAVSANTDHGFSKLNRGVIRVIRDYGGREADAHFGNHSPTSPSPIKKDPTRPNLRRGAPDRPREDPRVESPSGHPVGCGSLGENPARGLESPASTCELRCDLEAAPRFY